MKYTYGASDQRYSFNALHDPSDPESTIGGVWFYPDDEIEEDLCSEHGHFLVGERHEREALTTQEALDYALGRKDGRVGGEAQQRDLSGHRIVFWVRQEPGRSAPMKTLTPGTTNADLLEPDEIYICEARGKFWVCSWDGREAWDMDPDRPHDTEEEALEAAQEFVEQRSPGRPPKDVAGETASETLRFRCTPSQAARIREIAGATSLTDYILSKLL